MSLGNPDIQKLIVKPTRQIRGESVEDQIRELERQVAPIKSMEMQDSPSGSRVLQAVNIVIPNE